MEHFDIGTIIVIVITFVLFTIALFFTGFTHDLLLEAGIFLISIKLIVMAYKSSVISTKIESELKEIKSLLKNNKNT